jgi:hypothetical protein
MEFSYLVAAVAGCDDIAVASLVVPQLLNEQLQYALHLHADRRELRPSFHVLAWEET